MILFFVMAMSMLSAFAQNHVVALSQNVDFKIGDVIKLKGTDFSVTIGHDEGSVCAVPGKNCGAGYRPPTPTFAIDCGNVERCPYVAMAIAKDGRSGQLTIENEASCEKNRPENCFDEFARRFKNDEGCMTLKTPMGKYYCLRRFEQSARPENKDLCDQLPEAIFGLRWNCYYEHAIRYRDPIYCDRYPAKDASGRDRCLNKMAELLKDKSLCRKISASKEHTYLEQCLAH